MLRNKLYVFWNVTHLASGVARVRLLEPLEQDAVMFAEGVLVLLRELAPWPVLSLQLPSVSCCAWLCVHTPRLAIGMAQIGVASKRGREESCNGRISMHRPANFGQTPATLAQIRPSLAQKKTSMARSGWPRSGRIRSTSHQVWSTWAEVGRIGRIPAKFGSDSAKLVRIRASFGAGAPWSHFGPISIEVGLASPTFGGLWANCGPLRPASGGLLVNIASRPRVPRDPACADPEAGPSSAVACGWPCIFVATPCPQSARSAWRAPPLACAWRVPRVRSTCARAWRKHGRCTADRVVALALAATPPASTPCAPRAREAVRVWREEQERSQAAAQERQRRLEEELQGLAAEAAAAVARQERAGRGAARGCSGGRVSMWNTGCPLRHPAGANSQPTFVVGPTVDGSSYIGLGHSLYRASSSTHLGHGRRVHGPQRKFKQNPWLGRKQFVLDLVHLGSGNVSKKDLATKLAAM